MDRRASVEPDRLSKVLAMSASSMIGAPIDV
jgi:hypothetical protein